MNSAAVLVDTEDVQPTAEKYFVRLEGARAPVKRGRRSRPAQPVQLSFFDEPEPPRRRKRRRSRPRFALVLVGAVSVWALWASEQPGGVSGTVDRFVQRIRNDVQDASGGQGLDTATKYFDDQYAANGVYPTPSLDQLTSAGIDIDIEVVSCGTQAVVLRTVTVSRLLVAGASRGDVSGVHGCPDDLSSPSPWKSQ